MRIKSCISAMQNYTDINYAKSPKKAQKKYLWCSSS